MKINYFILQIMFLSLVTSTYKEWKKDVAIKFSLALGNFSLDLKVIASVTGSKEYTFL